MKEKIKVLVLVSTAWRSDNSGGNTLDNFFHGVDGIEFAHIYCDNQLPQNQCCSKYFQITFGEIARNFFLHKPVGHELQWIVGDDNPSLHDKKQKRSRLINWIIKIRPQSLILGRHIAWRYSNWKTEALRKFIVDFNPDVIFAPCYASPFQLALTRYVKKITGKKVVSWSGDDSYSLRQFAISPFFWLNRFWIRHCLRKTYPCFDDFYSMSEDEISEMTNIVGKKIKILRKGVHVPKIYVPRIVHNPIKFIYAGGLYCNRHKSLLKVARGLRTVNQNGVKAELHIYTGTELAGETARLLNDGTSTFNHGMITPTALTQVYQECDIAIHCESFDLRNRLATRLSFSTKIIDCFQSGCAILAIAWEEQTGLKYLKKEDAAICVTSINDIEEAVFNIVEHPEIIREYALKAYECEKKNHQIEDVQQMLYECLLRNSQ